MAEAGSAKAGVCDRCGALVPAATAQQHEDWHEALERAMSSVGAPLNPARRY